MRPTCVALLAATLAAAPVADAAPSSGSTPASTTTAPVPRARVVILDAVRGDKGTPESRQALREAIGRHLGRRGFQVIDGGKSFGFRLQPNLLLVDAQNGTSVEVKASVVALDRKGKVAAMVEGGARARGTGAGNAATGAAALEAQALEAAARSLVEDLAPRLLEAH